jgi:1-acyl-sn-glycerol-3-phosphate acyltransferase
MQAIKRELRVAFSPRVQPWWFRVIKWSVIIAAIVRYRQRRWFPYTAVGTLLAALSLHFFYRWKTQGWQRAWGGWDDVTA